MPHFGLMDEKALGPEAAAFQRARLHIRGGRRRIGQGKINDGIVTLYDALLFAMQWYISSPGRRSNLKIDATDDLRDDKTVFIILRRSGVLDGKFDFEAFDKLIEKILKQETVAYDYKDILEGIESVMTQLGVMPFDENKLPPEDPLTP